MNRRTLLILISATLALMAVLLLMPSKVDNNGSENLIPGLNEQLNEVTRVSITSAGNRTVATLERGESKWTVTERSGYPADVGKIRQNLIALGSATIVEEKTSDPALYDRLGIEDIDLPDAGGLRLDIYWPGQRDDSPTSLIVGDTGVRGRAAYARFDGETRGLMISADLDLGNQIVDWLARELIDVPASRIQAVTIDHPDGETLRIEKSSRDAADFSVLDIPDGRELQYPSIANSIGALLADLSLEDVSSAAEFDAGDIEPTAVRFETFEGLVIEANAYSIDDRLSVRFAASADEDLRNRFLPAEDERSGESADTVSDEQAAESAAEIPFDAVVEQAEEINTRLGTWVYTLPSFKSEQLVKRLDDLLKTEGE